MALQGLTSLFVEHLSVAGYKAAMIKSQLMYWIDSQAAFIRVLCMNLSWVS